MTRVLHRSTNILVILAAGLVAFSQARVVGGQSLPAPPATTQAAGADSRAPDGGERPATAPADDFELDAFVMGLHPPEVEEIIAWLEPVPTIEEIAARLEPGSAVAPPHEQTERDHDSQSSRASSNLTRANADDRRDGSGAQGRPWKQMLAVTATSGLPADYIVGLIGDTTKLPLERRAKALRGMVKHVEAYQYAQSGNLSAAIPIQLEVVDLSREAFGSDSVTTALCLVQLGVYYAESGEMCAARSAFAEGKRTLRKDNLNDLIRCSVDQCVADNHLKLGELDIAETILRDVLVRRRQRLGDNVAVALSACSLGSVLQERGDLGGAEAAFRYSLGIVKQLPYHDYQAVGALQNNLALILLETGKQREAGRLTFDTLVLRRQALGESNRDAMISLVNAAMYLDAVGGAADAEVLLREALDAIRKVNGVDDPFSAVALHKLGNVVGSQGEYAKADVLMRAALGIRLHLFGTDHPATGETLRGLAGVVKATGDYTTAESLLRSAANIHSRTRLRIAYRGLERGILGSRRSPFAALSALQARNGRGGEGWMSLEQNRARALLDEVAAPLRTPEEREQEARLLSQLDVLDGRIAALLGPATSDDHSLEVLQRVRRERDALQAKLSNYDEEMSRKHGLVAAEVYELERIRDSLREDEAFLAWVDVRGERHAVDPNGEHWACVVGKTGEPIWAKLPGSGPEGAWTKDDDELPQRVRSLLGQRNVEPEEVRSALSALYRQRIAPIESRLKGDAGAQDGSAIGDGAAISPMKHLIILPAGWMEGVPIESLTNDYTISYAPSGTMYAYLQEKARDREIDKRATSLLALGDPTLPAIEPESPHQTVDPPDQGVLVTMVMSGSNAARGGIKAGDVLLAYAGQKLAAPADLDPAIHKVAAAQNEPTTRSAKRDAGKRDGIPVRIWRDGHKRKVKVEPGKLGVQIDQRPAGKAIRGRRATDRELATGLRGRALASIPGTRQEVKALTALFHTGRTGEASQASGDSLILLGSDASERRLHELAAAGELKRFRYLHLATHGVLDSDRPMGSALIVTADEPAEQTAAAMEGRPVYDGRLTAEKIVRTWKLDADLVTLSACETALGKPAGGEGFLGFAQAFFTAGSRSLVVSLWKVDDTATALLMTRFYQNLFGQFEQPRNVAGQSYAEGKAMPKAAALREAKEWLRNLTAEQASDLESGLPRGDDRGEVRERPEVPERSATQPSAKEEHPYAAPYFWAAFILLGDPG